MRRPAMRVPGERKRELGTCVAQSKLGAADDMADDMRGLLLLQSVAAPYTMIEL